MFEGKLIGIYLTGERARPLQSKDEARAIAGKGLEGDRYAARAGTYSRKHHPGREVTLIEVEALEGALRDKKLRLEPAFSRRNLLTRDVPLNHLVGRRFRVGDVLLEGVELCDPCGHMERLSGKPGARAALDNRGGLRARIVEGGTLRVGDPVKST